MKYLTICILILTLVCIISEGIKSSKLLSRLKALKIKKERRGGIHNLPEKRPSPSIKSERRGNIYHGLIKPRCNRRRVCKP